MGMNPKTNETLAERFRWTMDLYNFGERMLRNRLRRKSPDATEAEIDAAIVRWRWDRPGAPSGDAEGRSATWPRHR
jgi:hypothetical protein